MYTSQNGENLCKIDGSIETYRLIELDDASREQQKVLNPE